MDSSLHRPLEFRTYRLKGWIKGLFLLMAVGAVGFGTMFLSDLRSDKGIAGFTLWILFPAMVLIGIYFGLSAFRYFVALDPEAVSIGGIFQTRNMRHDAIRGFRIASTRNGTIIVIESKDPNERSLKIADYFNFDDHWTEWLYSLTNLDAEETKALLESIASSAELGETPEIRLQKLQQAKTVATSLNVVSIAAAASIWLFDESLDPTLVLALLLLLALFPWVVLWLQIRSPLLYNLFGRAKDPRPTLYFVLIASGFGILFPTFNKVHSSNNMLISVYGCLAGMVLAFLFKRTTRESDGKFGALLGLFVFCSLYGFGLATQINTQMDHSRPMEFRTQVAQKRMSHGKSTSYYLNLEHGGSTLGEIEVSVPGSLYQSVQIGDRVCLTTHEGALRVSWYTVHLCR